MLLALLLCMLCLYSTRTTLSAPDVTHKQHTLYAALYGRCSTVSSTSARSSHGTTVCSCRFCEFCSELFVICILLSCTRVRALPIPCSGCQCSEYRPTFVLSRLLSHNCPPSALSATCRPCKALRDCLVARFGSSVSLLPINQRCRRRAFYSVTVPLTILVGEREVASPSSTHRKSI
jgi:hypothetical protein